MLSPWPSAWDKALKTATHQCLCDRGLESVFYTPRIAQVGGFLWISYYYYGFDLRLRGGKTEQHPFPGDHPLPFLLGSLRV